jgi:hypothetical protein
LLLRFLLEVSRVDIGRLDDFLAEKANSLYSSHANRSGSFVIEKNTSYSYNFGSISLVKDSFTLLYPFILIRASNYEGLVSHFYQEHEKLGKSLEESKQAIPAENYEFLQLFIRKNIRTSIRIKQGNNLKKEKTSNLPDFKYNYKYITYNLPDIYT